MFLLVEAVRQLRGECGPRQVAGAEVALAHGSGGVLSAMSTVILGTEATRMSDPRPVPPRPTAPPSASSRRCRPPAEPFWAATREQRLVLPWCRACERPIHFPREALPACACGRTSSSGARRRARGVVYAVR